ncbi:FAD-binding protein [Amycolatopsis sp. YIM 10]|uniref:FAD-binding protein n=1 Tax=Amycolatopsis sp. YIM 10 TaxID=2653857 RepID=UPI00128FFAA8|nr:FAD-binding protein [Amycolatopsis sp. YIM 10]QFU92497.1 3-oxosteroid 1-dehydrogenase [Amycolatopsis sp. YIM 10]
MSTAWDENYDVVVVGSGGGGLTAAYTAGSAGLRTLVLEKSEYFGGMTSYSGSCLWLPGNPVTARTTVGDSAAGALEYVRAVVGTSAPEEMQRAYVNNSAALVEFLLRNPVLRFYHGPFPDYYDAPGRVTGGRGIFPEPLAGADLGDLLDRLQPALAAHRFGRKVDRTKLQGGRALIGRLLLAVTGLDTVSLSAETPFTSLVVEDGRVTGVVAQRDGEPARIRAERGVLLAAGGFEANTELRQKWQGRDAQWTNAPATHTGDAILAGQGAGAALANMENAWWTPNLAYPGGTSAFVVGFGGGLFVNGTGRRFANESLPYTQMGQAILDVEASGQPALPVYWIFDDRFEGPPCLNELEPDRDEFRAAGLWHTADTIDELAGQLGLPRSELTATVTRFNSFAATGVDEDFHRGEDEFDRFFGQGDGPNPCLIPVDRGPFHAVQLGLGDLGTKGGLVTDPHGRVLTEAGDAIAGLYATGNTTASATGNVYPGPGAPIGTSMVFGFLAARHLAEQGTAHRA